MNRKTTKRALGLSFVSLLLCITMLMGTTFAWFTDEAKVSVNKLQAGTLDISLAKGIWTDGYMGAPDKTEDITDETAPLIGADILWEPGYLWYENLVVKNNGSLAAKIKATLVSTGEIGKLAEVIDVYTSDLYPFVDSYGEGKDVRGYINGDYAAAPDAGPWEAAFALNPPKKIGTLAEVINNDTLLVEEHIFTGNTAESEQNDHLIAIALKMQETAGNDYQGETAGAFDIRVQATQATVEFDSFDNQYDKNAEYAMNADELKKALETAQDGDVIVLSADMAIDELPQTGEKEVTLDLNGNDLTIGSAEGAADGLVLSDGAKLNLINTSAQKTTVQYLGESTNYDAIYIDEGELNIGGNVDVVVSPKASSAIHAVGAAVVNISEGTEVIVKGETDNQFAAIFIERGATVNMTGGTVTVESNLTKEDDGWNNDATGVVLLGNGATFNMTGGVINVHSKNAAAQGIQTATYNGGCDSSVNINGGTFNVTNEGTQGGSYAFAIFDPEEGTINVENATFAGNYTAAVTTYYDGTPAIDISGGTFAFDPSAYVVEGKTAVDNDDGTWTVQ